MVKDFSGNTLFGKINAGNLKNHPIYLHQTSILGFEILIFRGVKKRFVLFCLVYFGDLKPGVSPFLVDRHLGQQKANISKGIMQRPLLTVFAGLSCLFLSTRCLNHGLYFAWRIIPVSKWLVAPIYKPFRPFGRGITLLRALTNHCY